MPRGEGGDALPNPAAVMNALAAASGAPPSFELASFCEVLSRLRGALSSGDVDRRLQCEALVLGQLASARALAVTRLLPFMTEMMRAREGRGSEGIFLSVLSAAGHSVEATRALAALSTLLPATEQSSPFLFADLSTPHRAFICAGDRARLPGIFDQLRSSARSGLDVGSVVRASSRGFVNEWASPAM